jgi:DNA-binding NtrC family response regulator
MTRGKLITDGLFARAMRAAEVGVWKKAITRCRGNVTEMSNWLSVSRAWIHKRTAELGLDADMHAARKD